VKVVEMPEGVDPADLIARSGADLWRQVIKDSKHVIEFLLNKILKTAGGDARKVGKEVKTLILPFINALPSSIEKMHFVKKVSEGASIPMSALEEDLKKVEKEFQYENREIVEAKESRGVMYRKDYIERKLLGIVLWQRSLKEQNVDPEFILKELSETLGQPPGELLEKIKNTEGDLIFEAEVFYGDGQDIKKDTDEMLNNLKEEYLKEKLGIKMKELHEAENAKSLEKSKLILKEISEINNKIQEIKNKK